MLALQDHSDMARPQVLVVHVPICQTGRPVWGRPNHRLIIHIRSTCSYLKGPDCDQLTQFSMQNLVLPRRSYPGLYSIMLLKLSMTAACACE